MMTHAQRRTVDLVAAHLEPIAAFARDGYADRGRGVCMVLFPKTTRDTTLKYHALDDVPDVGEGAAVLRRQIETYDPTAQAVVFAAIWGHPPVSMKLKLQRPVIVEGPKEMQ
jgi:hypothetical protein